MLKTPHARATFGRSDVVFRVAGARDCGPCQKLRKAWGFCSISKNDGRRGTLKRICKDAFSVAGAVHDFLRGVAFWSLRSSGLRWFCVTGAALRMTWHHFFVAGRSSLDRWTGKIAKRIGTRPSALHSTFHFWRKSRRIALLLMFSTWKK